MSNNNSQILQLRRSAVPGKVPDTGSLLLGEIALNTWDGRAFMKRNNSSGDSVIELATTSGSIYSASYSTTASYVLGFDSSSLVTVVTFNTFSQSYYLDSSSFDQRLDNIFLGSTGYIPLYSSSNSIVNSILLQTGSIIYLGGDLNINGNLFLPNLPQDSSSLSTFLVTDGNGVYRRPVSTLNGSSGTSGIDGTAGTAGSSGTSGQDGLNGTAGSAGSSGTSVFINGNPNYLIKFDSSGSNVTSSVIYENYNRVSIGTSSSFSTLHVEGDFSIRGSKFDFYTSSISGVTSSILYLPTDTFKGAFFDYTVEYGESKRAGTVTAIWDSANVEYFDNSTIDVGLDTSDLVFDVKLSGSYAYLEASSVQFTWIVRVLMRAVGNGSASPGTNTGLPPGSGGTGSPGTSGTSGTTFGSSGTSGQSGTAGTSGTTGVSGTAGSSGASGIFGGNSQNFLMNRTIGGGNVPNGTISLTSFTASAVTEVILSKYNKSLIDLTGWEQSILNDFINPSQKVGVFRISKEFDSNTFVTFKISSSFSIPGLGIDCFGVPLASNGVFSQNDSIVVSYTREGKDGSSGTAGTSGISVTASFYYDDTYLSGSGVQTNPLTVNIPVLFSSSSLRLSQKIITSSRTLDTTDNTVFCSASSGNIVITLPSASLNLGTIYKIKKIDSSTNSIIITGSGDLIDGNTSYAIFNPMNTVEVQSAGGINWYIV